jgi:hypothetical protein
MDFASRAVLLLEDLRPALQACAVVLTLCIGVFALRRPRTAALLFLSAACFVTAVADSIYFTGSLQIQWKITVFPVEVRRVLFLLAELLYIVEVFLWPLALFLLIKERRAGIPPPI